MSLASDTVALVRWFLQNPLWKSMTAAHIRQGWQMLAPGRISHVNDELFDVLGALTALGGLPIPLPRRQET